MSSSSGDQIVVGVRVRPPSESEPVRRECLRADPTARTVVVDSPGAPGGPKSFCFDFVAGPDATQESIFRMAGRPATDSCVAGYNGTLFAYGQTGSGKTFTMMGDQSHPDREEGLGIAPRVLRYLWSVIGGGSAGEGARKKTWSVKCTMLEIYSESIRDLLAQGATSQHLHLREDLTRGTFVDGLHDEQVESWEQAFGVLKMGSSRRVVGETAMNAQSSRSHCVFTLDVQSREEINGVMLVKYSRLHLVDLAGSERQKLTSAAGQRLKEAGKINKSLSNLSHVISALADQHTGKERHVHYRDSKLTYLLKESLGGNSKTCIIATVSPSEASASETVSTLLFAQRSKMIKNKAVVNEQFGGNTQQLQAELLRTKQEMESLKAQIVQLQCLPPPQVAAPPPPTTRQVEEVGHPTAMVELDTPMQGRSQQVRSLQPCPPGSGALESEVLQLQDDREKLEVALLKTLEGVQQQCEETDRLRTHLQRLEELKLKYETSVQSLKFVLELRARALERALLATTPSESQKVLVDGLTRENEALRRSAVEPYELQRLALELFKVQQPYLREMLEEAQKVNPKDRVDVIGRAVAEGTAASEAGPVATSTSPGPESPEAQVIEDLQAQIVDLRNSLKIALRKAYPEVDTSCSSDRPKPLDFDVRMPDASVPAPVAPVEESGPKRPIAAVTAGSYALSADVIVVSPAKRMRGETTDTPADRELKGLREELDGTRREAEELRARLCVAQEEAALNQAKFDDLDQALTECQAEADQRKNAQSELELKVLELERALVRPTSEGSGTQPPRSEQDFARLEKQLASVTLEGQKLDVELRALRTTSMASEQTWSAQCEQLRSRVDDTAKQSAEQCARLAEANRSFAATVSHLRGENLDLKKQIETLRSAMDADVGEILSPSH